MKYHYKVTANLCIPLNVEFESSKHYSESELKIKAMEKLKIELGYILPDIEYLDSDITNIVIENLK